MGAAGSERPAIVCALVVATGLALSAALLVIVETDFVGGRTFEDLPPRASEPIAQLVPRARVADVKRRRGQLAGSGASAAWDAPPGTSDPDSLPSAPRVVKLHVLVDEEFREGRPRWEAEVRASITMVSSVLERDVAIRVEPSVVVPWISPDDAEDLLALHRLARQEVRGWADVTLLVTSQLRVGDKRGWGEYFGRVATVAANSLAAPGARRFAYFDEVLLHELGHVFGAWHVADGRSVMRYGYGSGPTLELGSLVTSVLRRTRDFDFGRGVLSLSPAVRIELADAWAASHVPYSDSSIASGLHTAASRARGCGTLPGRQQALELELEVIEHFDRVGIEANETLHDALVACGREYKARSMRAEAVHAWSRAVHISSRLPEPEERLGQAHLLRGSLHLESDELELAWENCQHALALRIDAADPDPAAIAEAYDYVGRVHLACGRVEQAEHAFSEALGRYESCGPEHAYPRRAVARRLDGARRSATVGSR